MAIRQLYPQYHPSHHTTRLIDNCTDVITSKGVVIALQREIKDKNLAQPHNVNPFCITTEKDKDYLLGMLNNDSHYESVWSIQTQHSYWQQFIAVQSNFGKDKGYIFMFVCSNCDRKVTKLYKPTYDCEYLCRQCHNLRYK